MRAKSEARGCYGTSVANSYAPGNTTVNDPKVTSGQQIVYSHMMQARVTDGMKAGQTVAAHQHATDSEVELGDLVIDLVDS